MSLKTSIQLVAKQKAVSINGTASWTDFSKTTPSCKQGLPTRENKLDKYCFKQPLIPRLFMHTPTKTMTATTKTTAPIAIPAIAATSNADGVVGIVFTVMLKTTWRVFVSSFGFREELRDKTYWPSSEWATWNNVTVSSTQLLKNLRPNTARCTPARAC